MLFTQAEFLSDFSLRLKARAGVEKWSFNELWCPSRLASRTKSKAKAKIRRSLVCSPVGPEGRSSRFAEDTGYELEARHVG